MRISDIARVTREAYGASSMMLGDAALRALAATPPRDQATAPDHATACDRPGGQAPRPARDFWYRESIGRIWRAAAVSTVGGRGSPKGDLACTALGHQENSNSALSLGRRSADSFAHLMQPTRRALSRSWSPSQTYYRERCTRPTACCCSRISTRSRRSLHS